MTLDETRQALIEALTQRLRPLCADWPDDLFTPMIERIAEISLKYDRRGAGVYDRRSSERLLNDLKDALERSMSKREGSDDSGPAH
jgi:hypothetical protein